MRPLSLAAAVLCTLGLPALAEEPPCLPIEDMIEVIHSFDERLTFVGVAARGKNVGLWMNVNTKTWTLTVLDKESQIVCVVSDGFDFNLPSFEETTR